MRDEVLRLRCRELEDDAGVAPTERARARRRDRDAEAEERAPMGTGPAKWFKQVLDHQAREAEAEPRRRAGHQRRRP